MLKLIAHSLRVMTDAVETSGQISQAFVCVVESCGQRFHLRRSLRSHYKYSHSNQYNKTTKTLVQNNSRQLNTISPNDCNDNYVINCNNNCNNSITYSPSNCGNDPIDKISNETFVFECNFFGCNYKTKSFDRISDHFVNHWQKLSP